MNLPPPLSLPAHPDVRIEAEERVWDGRFPLDRIRFRHRRFDGAFSSPRIWEIWRRGRAAAMLPYDPVADAVVLIEQFRLPALAAGLGPVLVEVPAGLCDAGESAEATIRREMVEETGLTAKRLHKVSDILLSPGGADELCTLFVGEIAAPAAGPDGLCGTSGLASEHEDIRLRVWPAERACAAALDGAFVNSVAMIALLWLNARRGPLRAEWTKA
ncbi:MAG: NUDIX domain-containing protein [Acetobacteraceae bacterium]